MVAPETPTGGVSRWVWFALLAIGVIVAVVYLWGQVRTGEEAASGRQAPAFSARTLQGDRTITLASLRGKPVVLNFWASWCGPCKQEAPLLEKASKRYRGRVTFLGVDAKDARSDALAFERQQDITYPSVFDEGDVIYQDYGLTGQPETFFIDRDGVIRAHVPGPLFKALLERDIKRILR